MVYPEEVRKIQMANFIKKITLLKKVIVGPTESMSKSKKNTVDPEEIINIYGADAVRWFILSDSPPEKDVQWSDQGMKILQIFTKIMVTSFQNFRKN